MGPSEERKAAEASGGRCPVDHTSSWSQWWNNKSQSSSKPSAIIVKDASSGGCPVRHDPSKSPAAGGCPVKLDSTASGNNNDNNDKSPFALPPSLEESARHAQSPHPEQRIPLSTRRAVSSIPRADEKAEEVPRHQPDASHQWVYPSEQQFYNAMRRKGWTGIDESAIPAVVRIHNAVNERGWLEVKRWEYELHDCDNPRLVRFLGRPNDMSPKAWINTNVFMYKPPFDRHDWFVDRGDGREPRRYVIDFYNGNDESRSGVSSGWLRMMRENLSNKGGNSEELSPMQPTRPPSMYIDVRPALDSPDAVVDRVHMFFRDALPGLFGAFGQNRSLAPSSDSTSACPQGRSTSSKTQS